MKKGTGSAIRKMPSVLIGTFLASCIPESSANNADPVIELSGPINDAMRTRLQSELLRLGGSPTVKIMSAGGDQKSGIAMGRLILSRKLSVYVDRYCLSACAQYIFLVSPRPRLTVNALVAFHSTALSDELSLRRAGIQDGALPKGLVDEEARLYEAAGLPRDLLVLPLVGLGIQCVQRTQQGLGTLNRFPSYSLTRDVFQQYGVQKIGPEWPSTPDDLVARIKALPLAPTFGTYLITRGPRSALNAAALAVPVASCPTGLQ